MRSRSELALPTAESTFGRYVLMNRLAVGGMGEVWAAQLRAPGGFCKQAVIKRILPEHARNWSFLRMLLTEARISAQLSHPNICAVFDFGEVDQEYYLAMEYLRGATLGELVRAGPLSVPFAAAIVSQTCDGLHYAHEERDPAGRALNLVHRDVSPQNIFVTVQGVAKLLDFGIAKVDDGMSEPTETGKIKGKLAYMSPEQLGGAAVDRRSDLWGLGVVLWEMLSGRKLFDASEGLGNVVDQIRSGYVDSLASVGAGALDSVIRRAVCVDVRQRFQTARELRDALLVAVGREVADDESIGNEVRTRCAVEIDVRESRFVNDAATAESSAAVRAPSVETLQLRPSGDPVLIHKPPASTTVHLARGRWPRARHLIPLLVAVGLVLSATGVYGRWQRSQQANGGTSTAVPADATGSSGAPPTVRATTPDAAAPSLHDGDSRSQALNPSTSTIDAGLLTPPDKRPRPQNGRAEKWSSTRSRGFGWLSADTKPWSKVYIDGAEVGITPLDRLRLSAGRHSLKFQTSSGRQRTVQITISPEQLETRIYELPP